MTGAAPVVWTDAEVAQVVARIESTFPGAEVLETGIVREFTRTRCDACAEALRTALVLRRARVKATIRSPMPVAHLKSWRGQPVLGQRPYAVVTPAPAAVAHGWGTLCPDCFEERR